MDKVSWVKCQNFSSVETVKSGDINFTLLKLLLKPIRMDLTVF